MTDEQFFDTPSPSSVNHVELHRERDRQVVNQFLTRLHPLGPVPGWKACFSGRYQDNIVGCVVVGRPVARHDDDGTEVSITRYCRRDDRPANFGSWLIARARDWCELEGYDTMSAHTGVAGNYGTVYKACGFTEAMINEQADATTWDSREDRDTYGQYDRRKWVYHFDG